MKLKPNWLEILTTAVRHAPVELPDPLTRTVERVLAHARLQEASWWDYLALRAAITGVAMAAVLLTASLMWSGHSQAQEARTIAEMELLLSIP
jgi:hypothetical protein